MHAGKFIENPHGRMEVKFNFTEEKARRNFLSPTLKSVLSCSENMTMTFHDKKVIKLDQNWLIGYSILELSKLHMYRSWYDTIMPTFGEDNVEMLFSDTDSLCFQIYGVGRPEDALVKLAPIMDFSNLDPAHALYNAERKNELGYFKSEIADMPLGFAGVKAKR